MFRVLSEVFSTRKLNAFEEFSLVVCNWIKKNGSFEFEWEGSEQIWRIFHPAVYNFG